MDIISNISSLREWRIQVAACGDSVALVPTMGFFHQGHTALMRMARRLADRVVVSLFVNPIQFGPGEDLDLYPRDLDRDRETAAAAGVDILFVPAATAMYPEGPGTLVVAGPLAANLCGRTRPGHFDGVCTVVAKLFNLVQPQVAVFGRKDFQQLAIIRNMVVDLDFPVKIVSHPIVREADGLALSSRNLYLDPEERRQALCLVQGLRRAKTLYNEGERDCVRLRDEVATLIRARPLAAIDYVSLVSRDRLVDMGTADNNTVMVLAVRVGSTRLIDNTILSDEDL